MVSRPVESYPSSWIPLGYCGLGCLKCLAASFVTSSPNVLRQNCFARSMSSKRWWTRGDSNPRPPHCERGALPAELLAHEQRKNFNRGARRCQWQESQGNVEEDKARMECAPACVTATLILPGPTGLRDGCGAAPHCREQAVLSGPTYLAFI